MRQLAIQIVSDIHFEFHHDHGAAFLEKLDPEGVDVLVVAGDVGSVVVGGYGSFMVALCEKYPHVILVPGNHEYYHTGYTAGMNLLRDLQGDVPNLHVLDNEVVSIDGQRFVGSTLWFDDNDLTRKDYKSDLSCYDSYIIPSPEGGMQRKSVFQHPFNDFNHIRNFNDWVWQANYEAVEFLRSTVQPDDVVVTHHVPTIEGIPLRFRRHSLTPFFVCELGDFIKENGPKLWLYGHTHERRDFTLYGTRLVLNVYGYVKYGEFRGFDWRKIVRVEAGKQAILPPE